MTDSQSYDVRLIDTGEIVKRSSDEIFKLDDTFKEFPRQAYALHLVGIVPNDCEDDWADSITNELRRQLDKDEKSGDHFALETQVLFSLRHAFVTTMVRAVNAVDGVMYTAIVDYLIKRKLATASPENKKKAIEFAKANGIACSSHWFSIILLLLSRG